MDSGFHISGIIEMETHLQFLIRNYRERVADALYEEAVRILELAKRRVPILTGALRDTGAVSQPIITRNEVYVLISFGDEIVKYAIPVHERIYAKHITGQSKYLESVMQEEESRVLSNIARKLQL